MTIRKFTLPKKVSPHNLYFKWLHFIPKLFRPSIQSIIFPSNPNRNFDLYISTGNNCTAAFILKILNLRTFSFPFDWLYGVSLTRNLDWILLDFKDFFRYQDLNYETKKIEGKAKHLKVVNSKTGTHFIHDFLTDSYSEFQSIQEKYNRRCLRLLNECKDKKVLLLYVEHNDDNLNYNQSSEVIFKKLLDVHKKLKTKNLTLLILHASKTESNTIESLQTKECSLYLFGSPQVAPRTTRDRHQLALLLKEILQTIEEDTHKSHTPSLFKES